MNPQRQSIDQRERVRKSFDKFRVNNPFDKDYPVVWDGFAHVVPAKSYAILDRFLADKWLEEQGLRIMAETANKAVKDENERRRTSNQLPMDKTRKTGEQLEFENPFYKDPSVYTDDKVTLEAAQSIATDRERMIFVIVKKYGLYGGLTQEYGMQHLLLKA